MPDLSEMNQDSHLPKPIPEAPDTPPVFRALACVASGFLLVAFLLHTLIRNPLRLHADERSEKLLLLDRSVGWAYSAAFGSSHLHNGFDPRAFDRVFAGTPEQTRTINLAIEGGSQSEQRAMALQFVQHLKAPPAPIPCFVVLELNAGANLTNDHLVHPRSIDIYDWPTVRFVSHLVEPHMSLSRRAGRVGFAVAAMILHYSNTGMLSNRIFSPPLDQHQLSEETDDDRRGILPLPDDTTAPSQRGHLLQILSNHPAHPAMIPAVLTPGHFELLSQLSSAAHGLHLSFVYIVMPLTTDLTSAPAYPDQLEANGTSVPIINLALPGRYPAIYQPSLFHDPAHLDAQGANLVTTILAQQLQAWYQVHGAPAPCGG